MRWLDEQLVLWRNKPIEPVYPVVYIDGMHVDMVGSDRTVMLVVGGREGGGLDVLGFCVSRGERCTKLLEELRRRGLEDVKLFVSDESVAIGSGRAERQMRRLLAALGLLQTVTIVPRLKPWRSIFGAGDIFIQPAASTAFNPLLLEAMSVGAAVAGCKGGVDDLIFDEQTAIAFDPDDELSIYQSLQRLFDRRELARQIARGAQEYLRKNHTVSNMISSTLQTYREAVQWYRR